MFLRKICFVFIIIVSEWTCNCASGNILGTPSVAVDQIRNVMEIYKIFDRSYNFFRHEKYVCYVMKNQSPNFRIPCQNGEIPNIKASNLQLQEMFIKMQARNEVYMTEFFSILFVKYVALVNSIRFIHGYFYLHREERQKEANMCARLAFYLATFANFSTIELTNAIKLQLQDKYPPAYDDFNEVAKLLIGLDKLINPSSIALYFDAVGEFRSAAFQGSIKYLNGYFGKMIGILDEDFDAEFLTADIEGNRQLWLKAEFLLQKSEMDPYSLHYNRDTGRPKDMFRSSVVAILRNIDLYNAEQNLESFKTSEDRHDIVFGRTSYFFVIQMTKSDDGPQIKFVMKYYDDFIDYEGKPEEEDKF